MHHFPEDLYHPSIHHLFAIQSDSGQLNIQLLDWQGGEGHSIFSSCKAIDTVPSHHPAKEILSRIILCHEAISLWKDMSFEIDACFPLWVLKSHSCLEWIIFLLWKKKPCHLQLWCVPYERSNIVAMNLLLREDFWFPRHSSTLRPTLFYRHLKPQVQTRSPNTNTVQMHFYVIKPKTLFYESHQLI